MAACVCPIAGASLFLLVSGRVSTSRAAGHGPDAAVVTSTQGPGCVFGHPLGPAGRHLDGALATAPTVLFVVAAATMTAAAAALPTVQVRSERYACAILLSSSTEALSSRAARASCLHSI